ncbi:MAG: DoxX family protein [Rhodanobacter sp.]
MSRFTDKRVDVVDLKATAYSLRYTHALSLKHRLASYLFSLVVSFFIRVTLVLLFLPFSAMDKLLNTEAAVEQAQRSVHSRWLSWVLLGAGAFVEVVMSLAVLTGFFDRLAAVILAGYCMVTALLWKQFWKTNDFRLKGPSKGRAVFWDFLKNFAVAGGFLVLATGGTAYGVSYLIQHPFSSSRPYSLVPQTRHAPSAYTIDPPEGVSP